MFSDPLLRQRRLRALTLGVAALAAFVLTPRLAVVAAAPSAPVAFVSHDGDDDDGYRRSVRYDDRRDRRTDRRDRRYDRREARYDRRYDRRDRRYDPRPPQPSRRHVWIPGHYSYDR